MGRFRVNVFRQRGTIAVVIRHIKATIPPFEELHLPEIIRELALTKRGLVLVTGTTGSGKSTTLASMIDYINQKESVNVITVEDPIEYLYKDNVAIISQPHGVCDYPYDERCRNNPSCAFDVSAAPA